MTAFTVLRSDPSKEGGNNSTVNPSIAKISPYCFVCDLSVIIAIPSGLKTLAISRQAFSRPSLVGMLCIQRLERTTSKVSLGQGHALHILLIFYFNLFKYPLKLGISHGILIRIAVHISRIPNINANALSQGQFFWRHRSLNFPVQCRYRELFHFLSNQSMERK